MNTYPKTLTVGLRADGSLWNNLFISSRAADERLHRQEGIVSVALAVLELGDANPPVVPIELPRCTGPVSNIVHVWLRYHSYAWHVEAIRDRQDTQPPGSLADIWETAVYRILEPEELLLLARDRILSEGVFVAGDALADALTMVLRDRSRWCSRHEDCRENRALARACARGEAPPR